MTRSVVEYCTLTLAKEITFKYEAVQAKTNLISLYLLLSCLLPQNETAMKSGRKEGAIFSAPKCG